MNDSDYRGTIGTPFKWSLTPGEARSHDRRLLFVGELRDEPQVQAMIEYSVRLQCPVDVVGRATPGLHGQKLANLFLRQRNLIGCLFHSNPIGDGFQRILQSCWGAVILDGRCDFRHWKSIAVTQVPVIGWSLSETQRTDATLSSVGQSYHKPNDLPVATTEESLDEWLANHRSLAGA